jgi:hypothetical protein
MTVFRVPKSTPTTRGRGVSRSLEERLRVGLPTYHSFSRLYRTRTVCKAVKDPSADRQEGSSGDRCSQIVNGAVMRKQD